MTRYVAFLRGINLGKRRVKMAALRGHFEVLGLEDIASHGASGNVAFDAPDTADGGPEEGWQRHLEDRIEAHLEDALGFFTDTMIRPLGAVDALTHHDLVARGEDEGFNVYVTFAKDALGSDVRAAFQALETPDDRFHVMKREVLWLRRGGISDSVIETRHLEDAFGGVANTRRKVTTLRKLVARLGA